MSNVLIVLKAARELLSDEKRWVKNNPTVWKSRGPGIMRLRFLRNDYGWALEIKSSKSYTFPGTKLKLSHWGVALHRVYGRGVELVRWTPGRSHYHRVL